MQRATFLNIVLALVWTFLQGELRALNFAIGLVLGYLIILVSERALGESNYVNRVWRLINFIGFVMWDVFSASLRLAWLVVQPRPDIRPGVVEVPLDAKSDLAIVTIANLITLSPGSVTLDIAADGSALYVHAMVLEDAESFRRLVKESYERRVIEVTE